ncbi:MAG TPA: hypothetical protein VEA63_07015 [Opitutus sp.]|nr:hypothetical protein [Opitutus sp.]
MAITASGLKVYQGGPEVTPGTPVAATRKFSLENLDWTPQDEVYRPRFANGVLLDNRGGETVISRGSEFTGEGPVIPDELHRWASMCIAADVITGSGPYTHTFTRNPVANPTLKTWTLERRLSDGSNAIDNEWSHALLRSLTISAAMDAPLRLSFAGIARRVLDSTLTAALSQVTTEILPSSLSTVFIDPAWADLGETQVTQQVLSFSVTFRSGINPVKTADGRTDLDFGIVTVNDEEVGIDISMRLMVKADSGQYATEKTAAEAQSLRAVRIAVAGAGDTEITIDALCKHVAGSLFKVDEQDGYEVFDMNLVSSTDLTNAYRLVVINAASAL